MKLKFRSKCIHVFTNYGYLYSSVWKALHNVQIKRVQEAIHNQFSLQNVQNSEIFEIFKMFKNNIWISFNYIQTNACSPHTACSVFDWVNLKFWDFFWVNLFQKLKIISLSWNFAPRLIQICRIPWWCLPFLFWTRNTFLGKFDPKNQNCQFELEFCTRLMTNLNKQNYVENMWCSLFLF